MALEPLRAESSGNINYGESNQVFSITWSPVGPEVGPGSINLQNWTLNTRFLVKEYRLEIISNFMGIAWLAYGDSDDSGSLTNWDPNNEELYSSLVQKKAFSGNERRTVMSYRSKWSKNIVMDSSSIEVWNPQFRRELCDLEHRRPAGRQYGRRLLLYLYCQDTPP